MRARVLVLVPLVGALIGGLIGSLVIWSKPPCVETAICRVDLRRGTGCLPGPCDSHPVLPVELWLGITVGLVLGLVVALALVLSRPRARAPR